MLQEGSIEFRDDDEKYAGTRHLTRYIRQSSDTTDQAFGEIMFVQPGKASTYSPYITISAESDPSILWNIFTYYWKLFLPHIIVCTVGEFRHHDEHWRQICKNSWIITRGSSPVCGHKDNARIIAIQQAKSFKGWKSLYSDKEHGLFPAQYILSKLNGHREQLDCDHTHFVFVEGSKRDVNKFRKKVLDYFGSRPIAFDSTRTKYVQIPIVVKLAKDNEDEILFASQCAMADHIIVIHEKAKHVAALVKKSLNQNSNQSHDGDAHDFLQTIITQFDTDEDRLAVQKFFKMGKQYNLTFYPAPNCATLKDAILSSLVSPQFCCKHTALRMALIWNHVDLVTYYFTNKEVLVDEVFLASCLHLALTLNRGSFLELMHDAGINVYSYLSVRMLWNLYYKCHIKALSKVVEGLLEDVTNYSSLQQNVGILKNKKMTTAASLVLHHQKLKKFELKYLMLEVGNLVSELTNYECENLYQNPIYVFEGAQKYLDDTSFIRNIVVDRTATVPHPVRDLFIWCLFTENNDLAKVLWKHGHEYIGGLLLIVARRIQNRS